MHDGTHRHYIIHTSDLVGLELLAPNVARANRGLHARAFIFVHPESDKCLDWIWGADFQEV